MSQMWRSSVRRAMPCTARGTATVKAAKHAQRGFGGPPADHRSHCAVSYPLTPIPVWPHAPRGGAAALWRLGPLHSAAEVEPTTRPEPHSLSVSYGGRSPPTLSRIAWHPRPARHALPTPPGHDGATSQDHASLALLFLRRRRAQHNSNRLVEDVLQTLLCQR